MPPSDQILEILFSFLLEKKGSTDRELQLATQPVCGLLQTRQMRGFEYVRLEVCRRGLGWARRSKEYFERESRELYLELRALEHRWHSRQQDELELVWDV